MQVLSWSLGLRKSITRKVKLNLSVTRTHRREAGVASTCGKSGTFTFGQDIQESAASMEPTGADGCSTPQVSPTGNGSVRRPGGDLRILLTCCALVMCSSTTLIAVPLAFELPTSNCKEKYRANWKDRGKKDCVGSVFDLAIDRFHYFLLDRPHIRKVLSETKAENWEHTSVRQRL